MKVYTITKTSKGEWPHGGTTLLAPAYRHEKDAMAMAEKHCDILYWDYDRKWIMTKPFPRLWVSKYRVADSETNMRDYDNGDAFYMDINEHEVKLYSL